MIEQGLENLSGMDIAGAQEYILNVMITLKLTEKRIQELDEDLARWNSRIDLTRSQGKDDLALEAETEAGQIREQQAQLAGEAAELKSRIEDMRKQIPLLAARERSVDPDLLEQELLMAAGRLPGDEEKLQIERQFREIEKNSAADAALEELKEKMAKTGKKEAHQ
ncbi:MAG: chromosome partitioning protein [Treponema sp.]|jgi:phage shock protein A|nr:chromosome partitioning protein [Treponema sp.]